MELPLAPIRILDLTHRLAGPMLTMLFGDWGADVLKIEWWRRMDGWRGMISVEHDTGGQKSYNKKSNWLKLNRNKRSVTLNLKSEAGKELFLALVRKSDVVAENFSSGVMERLGLGYETLKANNPRIIMVSMPGFGNNGPDSGYSSNGHTMEGYAGLSSITGYEDGVPRNSLNIWPDPVAGIYGAFAVGIALIQREENGQGEYIELAQSEALMNMIGDTFLEYSANGTIRSPSGNTDVEMAPHGVYPSQGDDSWISIAVSADTEWHALCKVAERDEWVKDERFSSQVARWRNRKELDELLANWTSSHDPWALSDRLQAMNVTAAPVTLARDLSGKKDFPNSGFHQTTNHQHIQRVPGPAARMDGEEPQIRLPPPDLGANTHEVLTELLGLTDGDIHKLQTDGAI